MRVGIDGRALQGQRAGTGRYVYELCKALDRELPNATFYIYSPAPVEMPVVSARWIARVDKAAWARYLKSVLWLKTRAGALCSTDNLDVFWANSSLIPSLAPSVRVVSTVHDITFRVAPETMKTVTYWAYRLFFERDIRRADSVVVNSQGTAKRLYDTFGYLSDGVIPPAVSRHFQPQDSEVVAEVLARLGVSRPYFLAVGALEPRKNLPLLVEVFVRLKKSRKFDQFKLVLAGGRGWKDQGLLNLLKRHSAASVMALGYVAESDLPALYAGANAFVFPSRYEGFGIPVLEARACGVKIVASDLPEIREAGGVGALYVPPTAEAFFQALKDVDTLCPAPDLKCPLPKWDEGAKILARVLTETKKD